MNTDGRRLRINEVSALICVYPRSKLISSHAMYGYTVHVKCSAGKESRRRLSGRSTPRRNSLHLVPCGGLRSLGYPQRVGAHFVPFLHHQAVGFKKGADAR